MSEQINYQQQLGASTCEPRHIYSQFATSSTQATTQSQQSILKYDFPREYSYQKQRSDQLQCPRMPDILHQSPIKRELIQSNQKLLSMKKKKGRDFTGSDIQNHSIDLSTIRSYFKRKERLSFKNQITNNKAKAQRLVNDHQIDNNDYDNDNYCEDDHNDNGELSQMSNGNQQNNFFGQGGSGNSNKSAHGPQNQAKEEQTSAESAANRTLAQKINTNQQKQLNIRPVDLNSALIHQQLQWCTSVKQSNLNSNNQSLLASGPNSIQLTFQNQFSTNNNSIARSQLQKSIINNQSAGPTSSINQPLAKTKAIRKKLPQQHLSSQQQPSKKQSLTLQKKSTKMTQKGNRGKVPRQMLLQHFWAKRASNNLQKRQLNVYYEDEEDDDEEGQQQMMIMSQVTSDQKEILLRKFEDQSMKHRMAMAAMVNSKEVNTNLNDIDGQNKTLPLSINDNNNSNIMILQQQIYQQQSQYLYHQQQLQRQQQSQQQYHQQQQSETDLTHRVMIGTPSEEGSQDISGSGRGSIINNNMMSSNNSFSCLGDLSNSPSPSPSSQSLNSNNNNNLIGNINNNLNHHYFNVNLNNNSSFIVSNSNNNINSNSNTSSGNQAIVRPFHLSSSPSHQNSINNNINNNSSSNSNSIINTNTNNFDLYRYETPSLSSLQSPDESSSYCFCNDEFEDEDLL